MKRGWTEVSLGEVLNVGTETCQIHPETEYREVTVSLWGKGVRLRRKVLGAGIAAPFRNVAREGNFIISKIDARNGAFGFIPNELDGAVVTNDFPLFSVRAEKLTHRWLYWISQSAFFTELCKAASAGTTNRVRLDETKFAGLAIPLPPLAEQQRIAARLDAIEYRLARVRQIRESQTETLQAALRSSFHRSAQDSEWLPMRAVAPIVRREVAVDPEGSYPELGIRSFGRGTFHKPNISGLETTKRLFEIHTGDLVFNIVFAWEGAVAVAQPADHGRFGSHRFISCVCDPALISTDVLAFYFQTPDGIEKLGKASPGGAGRNRTLGVAKLEEMLVPVPPLAAQKEFQKLLALQKQVAARAAESESATTALLPSLLDQIFN